MVNASKTEDGSKQRILESARKAFVRNGYAGTRMQQIADAAGINKALLHYYFSSKDQLFRMVFAEAFAQLVPSVLKVFASSEPIEQKIRTFAYQYISMLQEHPYIPTFILSEIHKDPNGFFKNYLPKQIRQNIQEILEQFELAANRGEIKRTPWHHLFINMLSLCIFPVAASPLLTNIFNMNETAFQIFLEERKHLVADFVLQNLLENK